MDTIIDRIREALKKVEARGKKPVLIELGLKQMAEMRKAADTEIGIEHFGDRTPEYVFGVRARKNWRFGEPVAWGEGEVCPEGNLWIRNGWQEEIE